VGAIGARSTPPNYVRVLRTYSLETVEVALLPVSFDLGAPIVPLWAGFINVPLGGERIAPRSGQPGHRGRLCMGADDRQTNFADNCQCLTARGVMNVTSVRPASPGKMKGPFGGLGVIERWGRGRRGAGNQVLRLRFRHATEPFSPAIPTFPTDTDAKTRGGFSQAPLRPSACPDDHDSCCEPSAILPRKFIPIPTHISIKRVGIWFHEPCPSVSV
jgi:hypothetical protein